MCELEKPLSQSSTAVDKLQRSGDMRSLQVLTSIVSRMQNGGLMETFPGATALAVCAGHMSSSGFDRTFWSSAAALRFRPTTAEPRRPDGGIIYENTIAKSIHVWGI